MAGQNYAKGQPVGNNQVPLYNCPPPVKAVAQYQSDNGTASSVITVSANTTAIEVAAVGQAALMRWVYVTDGTGANSSVTSANYDHVIGKDTVRRFVIPIERVYDVAPNASAVGANTENGLFQRVAIKTAGVGSVLTSEYGSSNSY